MIKQRFRTGLEKSVTNIQKMNWQTSEQWGSKMKMEKLDLNKPELFNMIGDKMDKE